MIRFSLHCEAGHEFESWFRDGAAFARQQARGEVACPECGSSAVEKAPMAPRLGRSREAAAEPQRPPSPAELQHHLRALRRHVETHCEHVGPRFADEARKIHRGEAEPRGIYGEATPRESEALADDGIEVARIPWIPLSDA